MWAINARFDSSRSILVQRLICIGFEYAGYVKGLHRGTTQSSGILCSSTSSKCLTFNILKCLLYSIFNIYAPSRVDLSLPVLLDDPILNKIAAKYNRSSAEVAMRFILQKGIVVLAKSFTPARIKQNLGVTTAFYYNFLNFHLL